jgi:hypothetical protein
VPEERNSSKFWKWLLGAIGLAVAGVLAASALDLRSAVRSHFHHEQYLTVIAHPISPQRMCDGESGWVLPGRPPQLSLPIDPAVFTDDWYVQHGAMPASGYYVPITLQGSGTHTVVITDVQVQVSSRKPAFVGSILVFIGGCGGSDSYTFAANLDTSPVVVKAIDARRGNGKHTAAVQLPHTLSESQPEVWYLQAITRNCACEWEAKIAWTSDGESGTTTVTDRGKPFQTVALTRARTYLFLNGAFHARATGN